MIGTANCTYETPCGWCTKWDKKCDTKIPEPPVINQYDYPTNKMCQSEEDHQWVCCGISSVGSTYYCTVCGKHKTEPIKRQDNVTISTYSNDQNYRTCSECDKKVGICQSVKNVMLLMTLNTLKGRRQNEPT